MATISTRSVPPNAKRLEGLSTEEHSSTDDAPTTVTVTDRSIVDQQLPAVERPRSPEREIWVEKFTNEVYQPFFEPMKTSLVEAYDRVGAALQAGSLTDELVDSVKIAVSARHDALGSALGKFVREFAKEYPEYGSMLDLLRHNSRKPMTKLWDYSQSRLDGDGQGIIIDGKHEVGASSALQPEIYHKYITAVISQHALSSGEAKVRYMCSSVELGDLMSRIVSESRRDIAPRKRDRLSIKLDIPESLQEIDIDPMSATVLDGVISELLKNPRELMERGNIELQVRASNGEMELTVLDDGPGVRAEMRDRIFQEGETTKPFGTGKGLSYARETVQSLLGGEVYYVGAPEGGAAFSVRFPFERKVSLN